MHTLHPRRIDVLPESFTEPGKSGSEPPSVRGCGLPGPSVDSEEAARYGEQLRAETASAARFLRCLRQSRCQLAQTRSRNTCDLWRRSQRCQAGLCHSGDVLSEALRHTLRGSVTGAGILNGLQRKHIEFKSHFRCGPNQLPHVGLPFQLNGGWFLLVMVRGLADWDIRGWFLSVGGFDL